MVYPFFTKATQHLLPLGTRPPFIALLPTQTFHPWQWKLAVCWGRQVFQSADWNSVRIKSVTFEQITWARVKWIFGLRLLKRLANPSLGYSSNCISSRLWPHERNLHIDLCLHPFHSLCCWAIWIGIWFSYRLPSPPENAKFLSNIIYSDLGNSWLFFFFSISTDFQTHQLNSFFLIIILGYFGWTFNLLAVKVET